MENVYKGRNKYGKREKWSPADASFLRQTYPPRRGNNRGFGLNWQIGKYGYRRRLLSPRCINSIRPEDSDRNSLPSASEQENAQQNLPPADVFFFPIIGLRLKIFFTVIFPLLLSLLAPKLLLPNFHTRRTFFTAISTDFTTFKFLRALNSLSANFRYLLGIASIFRSNFSPLSPRVLVFRSALRSILLVLETSRDVRKSDFHASSLRPPVKNETLLITVSIDRHPSRMELIPWRPWLTVKTKMEEIPRLRSNTAAKRIDKNPFGSFVLRSQRPSFQVTPATSVLRENRVRDKKPAD